LIGRSLDEFVSAAPGEAGAPPEMRLRRGSEPGPRVDMSVADVRIEERQLSIASLRDLTEREALEGQLRQAQKMEMLGRLAGGIAHDFNNLLGGVLLAASSLRLEIGAEDPGHDSVRTIERSAQRAAELTKQLLSFARRDAFRMESVAVAEVVAGVQAICRRTFGPQVHVAVEVHSDLAIVRGDEGQLAQALLNLCINARDAMPDGGTITIRTAVEDVAASGVASVPGLEAGRYVVISVTDTGVGMAADVQAHLFEPFFTTKARGKGTGLGLATSHGIVRGHGGAIRVHSEVGRGSRFDLLLRQVNAPVTRPSLEGAPAPPTGTETILVVDDEHDLRRAVGAMLGRLGYVVVEAVGGREGIERFRQQPGRFDLVLLDLLMPDVAGVDVFRAIRALRPEARVLLFTGFAQDADIGLLLEAGAAGVLYKPAPVGELAATVRRVLDAPAPSGSLEPPLLP
jgi:two-component system, cell cycle sensor histidine kinase and response regulator CckA